MKKPIDWVNSIFILSTPVIALVGTAWYVSCHGVTWLEIANFALMFGLTGIAITGGYHRYYAHRSYDCHKGLQLFYLIFGAASVENSLLNWASDHRYHHRFVDQKEDPYNILRGGLYAHIGWIFFKNTQPLHERYKNVPDLLKDPLVRWQDRWYLPLVVITSFALPAYIGLIQGRPVGGLLWGGFLRVVVVHHMTFFINSLAHLWGTRPYSTDNTARDNWWLGPLTFGEGYHNFHHAFQADYRNGVKWYQFDLGKWWIWLMAKSGLAWRLTRFPEPMILAAQLKVQMQVVSQQFAKARLSQRIRETFDLQLHAAHRRFEAAMTEYHQAQLDYRRYKKNWSEEVQRQWETKKEQYRGEFESARLAWKQMIRTAHRLPQPSYQGILTLTAVLDLIKSRFGA